MTDLTDKLVTPPDDEARLLAALAYGEASTQGNLKEISGIAHAAANRAKAWNNKTISEMIRQDPGYSYATNGKNTRFNLLMKASLDVINANREMRIAVNAAREALSGQGEDPSGGAYWWDGYDLKDKRPYNPRIKFGFKYGDPTHNIFQMSEICVGHKVYKKTVNKKTLAITPQLIGEYDCAYVSMAAHGGTIFWRYSQEFISATKTKAYR